MRLMGAVAGVVAAVGIISLAVTMVIGLAHIEDRPHVESPAP
jgi:hypothetical protein